MLQFESAVVPEKKLTMLAAATLLTFHCARFWSNELALANICGMLLTLTTFQLLIFWLKAVADWKHEPALATLPTFHAPMFWLNVVAYMKP